MSVPTKKEPSELPFRNGSSGGVVSLSTSSDSSKKNSIGQLVEDIEPPELKTKFSPKMKAKSVLSESFLRLGTGRSKYLNEFSEGFEVLNPELNRFGFTSRAERVLSCSDLLKFSNGVFPTGEIDDKKRLCFARFCKDRLCPMCNWRRSLKIFGQVSKILNVIGSQYRYIFLTLTVVNCPEEELKNTLDYMNQAFYRMKSTKRFKSAVKGFHRALEVTINQKDGTYHPHYHLILAVNTSYFKSRDYIHHSEWLQMWRDAMRDNRINQVSVEAVKPRKKRNDTFQDGLNHAVAEAVKYAVKDSEFLGDYDKHGNLIKPFPDEIIDRRVFTLANALRSRQLSTFGGVFRDTLKALNLDDAEDGDLVHLDDDKLNPYVAEIITTYGWRAGIGKFEKVSSTILEKELM